MHTAEETREWPAVHAVAVLILLPRQMPTLWPQSHYNIYIHITTLYETSGS